MQPHEIGLVDQVRMVGQKQNRVAGAIGSWLAFLAPLGSFALAHFAPLTLTPLGVFCTALLVFCLLFSAPKVYKWARSTYGSWVEAVGFVGLTEGLSLAPHGIHWFLTLISFYALIVLLVVNAVTGAVRVALSQRELRAAARAAQAAEHVAPSPAAPKAKKSSPAPKKKTTPKKRSVKPAPIFSAAS